MTPSDLGSTVGPVSMSCDGDVEALYRAEVDLRWHIVTVDAISASRPIRR